VFTPELTNEEDGTYILVSNHALEDPKARQLSVEYNLARIKFGMTQLPARISRCILVYDIRGQHLSTETISSLKATFVHIHELRFMK